MMKASKAWWTVLIALPLSASLLFVSLSAASAVSRAMTATLVGFILAPRTTINSQMPDLSFADSAASSNSMFAAAEVQPLPQIQRPFPTWSPGRYRQLDLLIAEGFVPRRQHQAFGQTPWPEFAHPWIHPIPSPARRSGG